MKSNELIKLLKKNGCYYLRQGKGSHEIWYSSVTDKIFIIPNHSSQELGSGLVNKILKIAGSKK